MAPSDAELERYRDPDEGLDQWRVKKAFLEKNWDAFPEERRQKLVTLMHCFHNMHVWGCSYPPQVMARVKELSEGLMTTEPKAARKPSFVKINFVAATPVTNKFSVLEKVVDEVDGDVVLEKEMGKIIAAADGASPEKRKQKKNKKNKKKEAVKPPETETQETLDDAKEEEDEDPNFPRCGLGFKSSATEKAPQTTTTKNFVFGIKDDYVRRLGFVKASESNEGFQFGRPVILSQKPALESGIFQFGVDNNSTKRTSEEIFTFGKGRKERLRSSEDLQQRFENASLQDTACKPKKKALAPEPTNAPDQSGVLESLEAVRSTLRKIRPPLAQSRIEFLILQVNLSTQGKVKLERDGEGTTLMFENVAIGSGLSEPEAYEDLRKKILSPDPWYVCSRGSQLILELGDSREVPSPAKRRPSDVNLGVPLVAELPRIQSPAKNGKPKTPKKSKVPSRDDCGTSYAMNPNLTAQVPQSVNTVGSNPKNAQAPLTQNAQSMILRNLDAVRRAFCTSNFRTKIEMLGGFDKDPISALNMAFQMAALKPVKEAEVPSSGCRFNFTSAGAEQLCTVRSHGVVLCEASAKTNRDAKKIVSLNLLNILRTNEPFRIVNDRGENRLVTRRGADPGSLVTPARPNAAPVIPRKTSGLEGLFLVRLANNEQDMSAIISRSSHANDLAPPEYIYSIDGNEHVCHLKLRGKSTLEFEGRAKIKALSKDEALRAALNTLIASCPTILVSSYAHDAQEFLKDTMPLGAASASVTEGLNRKIAQDNVGFQLLEKMGWTGGGLGGGGGLIEPIMFKDNSGSRGLGYTKSAEPDKRFLANISSTLRAFLRESDVFQELKFSPTFSNVERKHIHTIARRLGLKSKSSDRPEGRVLCVSHNIDWKMILDSLMRKGGSLGKFQLLPPGSWSLQENTSQNRW